jgi:hypothetical protein
MRNRQRSSSRRANPDWADAVHEIYLGRNLVGSVRRTDAGWFSELADETIVGTFPTEQVAIRAVFDAESAER